MHKATIKAMNQLAMWSTANTHHRNWRYWSLLCQYAPRVCQERPRHTGSVLAASVNTTNSSMINSCPTRSSRLIFRPLLHIQRSLRQVQAACRQVADCLLMGEMVGRHATCQLYDSAPHRGGFAMRRWLSRLMLFAILVAGC